MTKTKQTVKLKVKDFAISLIKQGYDCGEIAAELSLKPNSVRAWKAWLSPSLLAKKTK